MNYSDRGQRQSACLSLGPIAPCVYWAAMLTSVYHSFIRSSFGIIAFVLGFHPVS